MSQKVKFYRMSQLPQEGEIGGIYFITGQNPALWLYTLTGWEQYTRDVTNTLSLTNTTYNDLKEKASQNSLIPGMQYRITDYVTMTKASDSYASAGHPFDIIVTADSTNTLNENARAVQHEGDTYFANSNLAVWKLKYKLDNDSTYVWVDDSCKGVIYETKRGA